MRTPRLALLAVAAVTGAAALAGPAAADSPDWWTPWTVVGSDHDAHVRSLDYPFPGSLYAGSEGEGVFASVTAGVTWAHDDQGLTTPGQRAVHEVVSSGATLYAATSDGLYRGTPGGVWSPVGQSDDPGNIKGIAVNAVQVNGPTDLVIGAASAGILRSVDGGAHWSRSTDPYSALTVFDFDTSPIPGSPLYAATDQGIMVSLDGGSSWVAHQDGIPSGATTQRIEVSAFDPKVLYAATVGNGIYRSEDAGLTWSEANGSGTGELTAQQTRALVLGPTGWSPDPAHPRYIAGTENGVWASADDGETWGKMNVNTNLGGYPMGSAAVWALGLDLKTPTGLFAGTWGHGVMSVPLLPLSAPGGATPSLSPSAASGNQQDEPITAGTGTWNGTLPIFPTFAWYRCAGSNTNSCPTKLSDSRTYTPTATDVGNKLKLVVSAHGLLPTSATEVAYTSVIAAPPGTEPSIKVGKYPTITPNDSGSSPPWGQTYTATVGQWDNSPTSYVIRWQRCDGTCTDIPGAANSGTTSSYTSTHADVGHTLRILVAATGAGGTGVAYGYTTFSIIEKTPVNVDAPRIIGSPYLGLTVSSSAGGWQGYDITYDRQWFACDEPADNACSPIPSASDVTFTPTANLRGSYLRLRVTASNRAGSADDVTVYSAFAGPVADAPPPPPFGAQPPAAGGGGAGAGSDAGGSAGGPGSGSGPPQTFVPFPKTLSLTVPKRLRVGAKLKAPASVAGATSVRYRWLRNGKAIKKATKRAYRVTRRDRGKRIACRLTVSGPAGRAVIVTRAVRIPRRR